MGFSEVPKFYSNVKVALKNMSQLRLEIAMYVIGATFYRSIGAKFGKNEKSGKILSRI